MMRSFRCLSPAGWALLTVLIAALAVACGDDDGGASPTATLTPDAAEPTATEVPTVVPGVRLSTVEIVRKLRPSVVQVLTEGATRNVFGQLVVPSQGIGTGVIIDTEGHIVTNDHVVRIGAGLASRITVTLADGRTAVANVVGADPQTDLAVIQIDMAGLAPAELGVASTLPVGSEVVAMGFALGLEGEPTVTRGVVSAKGRTIQEQNVSINDAFQTDASINPGNSGGPLVDDRGRVVGINTAIVEGGENIGFSISIDLVKPIVEELIQNGGVERGFLGIQFTDITPSLARNLDLPTEQGVGITVVVSGSPADEAGLRRDDIIVRLGKTDIRNSGDLLEALRHYRQGELVALHFYREGGERETEVTLSERPR